LVSNYCFSAKFAQSFAQQGMFDLGFFKNIFKKERKIFLQIKLVKL